MYTCTKFSLFKYLFMKDGLKKTIESYNYLRRVEKQTRTTSKASDYLGNGRGMHSFFFISYQMLSLILFLVLNLFM